MQAIVTVVGKDRVGIIAGVSSLLSANNVNILDISQTILQDYFTMMMLVDLSYVAVSLKELKEKLDVAGKELKVAINMQHADVFQAMHRI